MNYSKSYFGKEIHELTYRDLVDFFQIEQEETDRIEFKSYSKQHGNFNNKLEGVIRGICAFLNSEGGILIWGAPEGTTVADKKEKVFIGELSPVDEFKEKDSLISKISDSITPLPVGIKLQILESDNSYLYVFEIQKSNYSPHQFKNTYYARLDGQTKPAPHYLVEALFRQIKYPNIEGFIKPVSLQTNRTNYSLNIEIYLFNFSPLQNEENAFFRLMCPDAIFERSLIPGNEQLFEYNGHMLIFENFIEILHFGAPNIHSERLRIQPETNEINLHLMFGGKKSPMKSSVYKLDLMKAYSGQYNHLNELIVEIEENRTNAEKQDELGRTKEQTLRDILER